MAEDKIKSFGEAILKSSLTRRQVIQKAGHLAAAGLAIRMTGVLGNQREVAGKPRSPEFFVNFGPRELILPAGWYGLKWFPDTHTTIFKDETGELNVFLSGGVHTGGSSFLLKGPDLFNLRPHRTHNGLAIPVLEPDPNAEFGRDYRGLGKVIKNPVTGQLIGVFHAENHYPKGFHSSIGLATSNDGGATWQNPVKILTGRNEFKPGETTTGAGHPNAIIMGEDIYLYHIDWSRDQEANIRLAKAPLADCTNPESWLKLHEGSFSQPGISGDSSAVVVAPESSETIRYAAYPGVSRNDDLGGFVMTTEDNGGFNYSISVDGIHWSPSKRFFDFEYPQQESFSPEGEGRIWNSYPTLLNGNRDSDNQTGLSNYLIHSEGVHGQPHYFVGRTLKFN